MWLDNKRCFVFYNVFCDDSAGCFVGFGGHVPCEGFGVQLLHFQLPLGDSLQHFPAGPSLEAVVLLSFKRLVLVRPLHRVRASHGRVRETDRDWPLRFDIVRLFDCEFSAQFCVRCVLRPDSEGKLGRILQKAVARHGRDWADPNRARECNPEGEAERVEQGDRMPPANACVGVHPVPVRNLPADDVRAVVRSVLQRLSRYRGLFVPKKWLQKGKKANAAQENAGG